MGNKFITSAIIFWFFVGVSVMLFAPGIFAPIPGDPAYLQKLVDLNKAVSMMGLIWFLSMGLLVSVAFWVETKKE